MKEPENSSNLSESAAPPPLPVNDMSLEDPSPSELPPQENKPEPEFDRLNEIDAPPPDENPGEAAVYRHQSLERRTSGHRASEDRRRSPSQSRESSRKERLLIRLYTYSWLIFFSIFGTLARLGVEWLGSYPNAPLITTVLWANVGGCFVLGFLREDRFLHTLRDATVSLGRSGRPDLEKGRRQPWLSTKKQMSGKEPIVITRTPLLYIGLSVGFCGSFTSYSSFMRDLFLALSNDLSLNPGHPAARNDGWDVSAVLAVGISEVGLSLAALYAGAHFSEAIVPLLTKFPRVRISRYLNPAAVLLGPGCWLGAVLLAIWPPQNRWRGDVVFALVFAPLGCLLRFLLSIKLNGVVAKFPLGTFSANILGTVILGLAYDLQHAPLTGGRIGGGLIGCQLLSGVMDGFCGCLTTVSTWVTELQSLQKRHAYIYGVVSIGVGLSSLIIIMGSLQWKVGLSEPACLS